MSRLHEAAAIDQPERSMDGQSRSIFTPRRVFLPLAWIFGVLYVLITPPFQVPDEYMHFYRAYQVSEGRLTAYRVNGVVGGYLPQSLWDYGDQVAKNLAFNRETKASAKALWSARAIPLSPEVRRFYSFGNVSWYSPLNYAPQAIGIATARLLGLGPMGIFYAARLANLLIWSLVVYSALRLIPILHWTLVLLAMTPMCLAQASSISADATVNSVCVLFVAAVVRLALQDGPIRTRQLVWLIALGAAASLVKTAYFPLTILFLLLPAGRFANRPRYWLTFIGFILICIATIAIWSRFTFGAASYSMENVSPHQQLIYMLHHPLRMIHMEVGMLVAIPFLSSIIGQLGWHDIKLWLPCTVVYWGMLFWSTRIGQSNLRISTRQRIILALAAVGSCIAVFSLIYLTFTTIGGTSINGLQGRYMIPIMLPFFLIFYPGPKPQWRNAGLAITVFAAVFSIYALAVLVNRFYI